MFRVWVIFIMSISNLQLVLSQDFLWFWSDLPSCGLACARGATELNGCPFSDVLSDVVCACSDLVFRNEFDRCISFTCPNQDISSSIGVIGEICKIAPSPTSRPLASSASVRTSVASAPRSTSTGLRPTPTPTPLPVSSNSSTPDATTLRPSGTSNATSVAVSEQNSSRTLSADTTVIILQTVGASVPEPSRQNTATLIQVPKYAWAFMAIVAGVVGAGMP